MDAIYVLVVAALLSNGEVQASSASGDPLSLEKCVPASEMLHAELRNTKPPHVVAFTVYCVPIHVPAEKQT